MKMKASSSISNSICSCSILGMIIIILTIILFHFLLILWCIYCVNYFLQLNINNTDVSQEYGDDDFSASIDVSSAETAEIAMDATKNITSACATTDTPTTDAVVATQNTSEVVIFVIIINIYVFFNLFFNIIYVKQLEHTLMSIAQEGLMRMRGVTSCLCQHARG